MFTGIVEELGTVISLDTARQGDARDSSARLTVRGPLVTSDAAHGDSIAVSGVCLTVVELEPSGAGTFTVDVMPETLAKTTIGALQSGDPVNLERSVTPTTRLGGHVMQGHVDGPGRIVGYARHERWDDVTIEVSGALGKYVAPKGAIALDGISLTVIDVQDVPGSPDAPNVPDAAGAEPQTRFTVGIIPETRAATTMGSRDVGAVVNIEVDVMAKYVERLLAATAAGRSSAEPAQPKEYA